MIAVSAGSAGAQITEVRLTTSPQAPTTSGLGNAVGIYGTLVAVGAPRADDRAPQGGAVYIFELKNGRWAQTATLTAPDGARNDNFGDEIALGQDVIVVLGDGDLYVFERTRHQWQLVDQLQGDIGNRSQPFAFRSLALAGSVLVGGSTEDSTDGKNAGAIYLFEQQATGWIRTAKFTAPNAARFAGFGNRVATDGSTLATTDRRGNLYIYGRKKDEWRLAPTVELSPAVANHVAVRGKWMFLTTGGAQTTPGRSIVLLRRSRTEWRQVHQMTMDELTELTPWRADVDSLAVEGKTVVLGDRRGGQRPPGFSRGDGLAYLLRRKGRRLVYDRFLLGEDFPPEINSLFFFGWSVAVDGSLVVVGAPGIASAFVYRIR